jgi:hypothetical protein
MNSQRAREHRIVEKLASGALSPASAGDPAEVARAPLKIQPGEGSCHGCDERAADVRVGDHLWHHLCFLFWQGRSETLRERHVPNVRADPSVTPERSHWVIVTRLDRPEVVPALRRMFAGSVWVDVVVDRRRGERRQGARQVPGERRQAGRRSTDQDPAQTPPFRLAHRADGYEAYEATGPVPGRCPQCGARVSVELPRFVEPPVHLDLAVVHEPIPPDRARHMVDLQSFSATGRVLLASRLLVRTRTGPA